MLLWIICFSGNYGGALGANALAKGLEGNKSLRVQIFLMSLSIYTISILRETFHKCVFI